MKILGTGLSGLVGSRIVALLSDKYEFENLSLETGVDITDSNSVNQYINKSEAPWVFHMAAYTDVQTAEQEASLTVNSVAWKVNVQATETIVECCRKTGKRVLYVDTDYAFDGTKTEYVESDPPNPLGWYAKTKTEGANRVLSLGDHGLVIRISNPYRALLGAQVGKKDFVHKMLDRLRGGQAVAGAVDQLFTPTFIDDLAPAIDVLVGLNKYGIYHAVSAPGLRPFDAALIIAKEFGFDPSLVTKGSFEHMFAGKAPVPQKAVLSSEKIRLLGVVMRSFAEGIQEVHKQESDMIQ